MLIKILFFVSVWYVFYFMICWIGYMFNSDFNPPKFYIFGIGDIIGNNVYLFIPSFIFQLWFWTKDLNLF